MTLRLVFHGGKCCGIKTIYDLAYDPTHLACSLQKKPERSEDVFGEHVNSNLDFFTDEAPEETYKERLDRLIAFCEARCPNGIIEITLADSDYSCYDQIKIWAPLLRRRKFRCVNKCKNSNSGNTVYVFHRNSGEGK